MPRHAPDLRFGPGTSGGFTPAGVAAFDNLRPAAVVREFIQNSLDAARNAGVRPAIVRFRLARVPRDMVPGIESYERAFAKAVETQEAMTGGPLIGQAQLTAGTIRNALAQDEMDVLCVLDNGVGLNEQRMNALLSDGMSVKDGAATGTYGNGHSTAIPASDLRYLLYGGLTEGGHRIGAGHAVLASHYEAGKRHQRSGDGFYIRDFRASHETLYDYATGHQLPGLIAQALDLIEAETSHGTAVIIPAFNHFLEEQGLWPMVSHAASANFFVAIEEGDLVVSVEDHRWGVDKYPWTLDRSNLADVLDTHRDKRRAAAFLNGRRAFEAHDVYRTGERHLVETDAGAIEIRLRENPDGITRVDLCRNGMWITDRIPGVSQSFADQVPFQAVLSLNALDGRDLHDFIRIAEGPLHDAITIKRLPAPQRKACRSALGAITQWMLAQHASRQARRLPVGRLPDARFRRRRRQGPREIRQCVLGPAGDNPAKPGARASPVSPPRASPKQTPRPGSDRTEEGAALQMGDRRRARPSLPAFFQAASCPAGKNRRRIRIECEKSCVDAQLRLIVDEALDATCERPGQDPYTPAVLDNITIDAKPAGDKDLIRWDDQVIGVRLGDLAEGASVEIETDYQLCGDFSDLSDPSLTGRGVQDRTRRRDRLLAPTVVTDRRSSLERAIHHRSSSSGTLQCGSLPRPSNA